jgi:DNA-binding MarR family transcriptional regulator
MNQERDFKGVFIPAIVWESKDVCITAKAIFAEIDSYTRNGKDCFVSNQHLADFAGINVTQVSRHVSKLIELGWIEQTGFDGRKRYLRSTLTMEFKAALYSNTRQPCTQIQGSPVLKANHTNTSTIRTTKNTEYKKDSGSFSSSAAVQKDRFDIERPEDWYSSKMDGFREFYKRDFPDQYKQLLEKYPELKDYEARRGFNDRPG